MKKQTIQDQLVTAAATMEAEDWGYARKTLDALSDRRLQKHQKEALAELQAQYNEDAPEEEGEGEYSMAGQLKKYRERYQVSITATGSKSLSNGDKLAKFLEQKTPNEVCAIADTACEKENGFHQARYQNLNPGQQRMNAGNKLRALVKKGEWQVPA